MFSSTAKTKKRVIDVLFSLLYEKPFSKISVIDILEEADISKGTFYKYFVDKYELAKDSVESYFFLLEKNMLFINPSQHTNEYISFFNATRFQYMAIQKLEDSIFNGIEYLKRRIASSYQNKTGCTDMEADFFASQTIWTLDYLASLKKNISKEDIDSLFFSFRKVMALARP